MDATRFDQIAKRFAARRLSRRQALSAGGTGLAAGALVAAGLGRPAGAHGQDATPPATTNAADKVMYLFVQAFRSGTIAPKAGAADTYTMTLEGGLGQTVYFSDRPERIVGAAPTAAFLQGLGFTPANPPNAALVVEPTPGTTEIAVVELFEPHYDETTHTATYDAKLLADYAATTALGFHQQPGDLAALAPSFGAAHLFIDDCSDESVTCCTGYQQEDGFVCTQTYGSFGPMGFCWEFGDWCCHPCQGTYDSWTSQCNATYSGCGGACVAIASGCGWGGS